MHDLTLHVNISLTSLSSLNISHCITTRLCMDVVVQCSSTSRRVEVVAFHSTLINHQYAMIHFDTYAILYMA